MPRFLYSKTQNPPSARPHPLHGSEALERDAQAKQGLSDWSAFLCAAMKEERWKADSSRLAMTEAEQRELYDTIKHALHSLRKHKVGIYQASCTKSHVRSL